MIKNKYILAISNSTVHVLNYKLYNKNMVLHWDN